MLKISLILATCIKLSASPVDIMSSERAFDSLGLVSGEVIAISTSVIGLVRVAVGASPPSLKDQNDDRLHI